MKTGTAQCMNGGSPSHAATSYSAANEMENATSPATAVPATTARMNRPSFGFTRRGSDRIPLPVGRVPVLSFECSTSVFFGMCTVSD